MARISLLGGSYKQASAIAGAQRCINLYPEFNSERSQAPAQVTHYSRPGLTALGTPPIIGAGRALYAATTGQLYCVIDQNVYYINAEYAYTLLGTLPSAVSTPVSIIDNGITAFLVDGSLFGSQIDLATNTLTQITDPNFLGGTRADFLDGFVVLNQPNTIKWYCTESYSNVFNNLFIGQKTAWPDLIQTLIVNERQAWIFGRYKAEIWQNAGLAPFPFQLLSGNIIEHGIAGPYAIARQDVNIYWVSESPEGSRLAMRGVGNSAERISTHAIEHEWLTYQTVADCICTTYQIRGHQFVCFDFPIADRTWVFDEVTQEWHEEAWYDTNGNQHLTRDTFKAYAYGLNLSIDWITGQLYQKDESNFTDNGLALQYKRGFPHFVDNMSMSRLTLWRVIADMECGTGGQSQAAIRVSGVGTAFQSNAFQNNAFQIIQVELQPTEIYPNVWLKISRDRGNTFFTHSVQQLGVPGPKGYAQRPSFNRCGMAYDLVLLLEWSGPLRSALNGVFAEIEEHAGDV